jgi:hypothetical protein
LVEQGKKKAIACAFDWPGWDRAGKSEPDALAVLEAYRPRYAKVAGLAGLQAAFNGISDLVVVERIDGSSTTDYHGVSAKAASAEQGAMSPEECERKIQLLRACWSTFDDVAGRVSAELRKGPRGGGRDRDRIVQHTNGAEMGEFSKKVGVVGRSGVWQDSDELWGYRDAFCAAIRDYNTRGEPARSWTLQFLIRRCAYHMLDHAWEMEDRDLGDERD